MDRSENEQQNTVEFVITAHFLAEVRHLTNVAFDFFGESIISFKMEYGSGPSHQMAFAQSSKLKEIIGNSDGNTNQSDIIEEKYPT
jgi:hypothetical protein